MLEFFLNLKYKNTVKKLEILLAEFVGKKRFRHVRRVSRTAQYLARRHGVSPVKAKLVAYLHDLAREFSDTKLMQACKLENYEPKDYELKEPIMLHGRVAGFYGKSLFGIKDRAILEAVAHHTLGVSGMGKLGMVLFAADYLEPGRSFTSYKFRKSLKNANLAELCLAVLDHSLQRGMAEHEVSKEFRIYLSKQKNTDIVKQQGM